MVYNRDNGRNERPVAYKSTNDRISKSYRSPPLSARVSTSSGQRYEEHRSRRDEESISCLSKFYRERFGSHSPEDYLNLRMSQFDKSLSKDSIRQALEREFKALAPFEIKIVQNPEGDDRLAYVNFERPECAKIVRRNMIPRLQKVLGRRIVLDPAGVIRDQEGKFIPDRYNRAAMAAAVDRNTGGGRSPRPQQGRRRSPTYSSSAPSSQGYSVVNLNSLNGIATALLSSEKRRDVQFTNLNLDDTQASRTLFVGNLPGDVRETELKRAFENYGNIDNIDIKILQDSNAAFAFILYTTVEEAIEAKNCQHKKPIRPGSSKCQIGYGKSQVTQRLYVGRLGPWADYDMLMGEFDRYGAVDTIEFDPNNTFAYIRYENLDSAVDACARMKNFDLNGKGKHITVDFAKKGKKRARSDSDDDYDSKRRGPRTPSISPGCSPTEAGYIQTFEELRNQVASTWKGIITLKKSDYPLGFYRVFGREHLLQDMLRDDAGNSLKLNISQKLPLDNAYYQRMIDLGKNDLALMVAVESNECYSVLPLVKYLQEKSAAGVINIKGGNVHILAYSIYAERLLKFFSPRIALIKPNSNYLLIALKRNTVGSGVCVPQNPQPQRQQPSPQPFELPPPPPLPSLGALTSMVKREPEEEKMPLRKDRSAIQLQLKVKQEDAFTSYEPVAPPPPPPLPPQLSPPPKNGNSNHMENDGGQSSSEGENDHRRARRHRKDDDEEEERSEEDSDNEVDDNERQGDESTSTKEDEEEEVEEDSDNNEED